jgi:hypothetical protein
MDGEKQVQPPAHTGRKIYLVPFVQEIEKGPADYADYNEKVAAYWREVGDHLSKLESRFGQIRKIFHESLVSGGDEGLQSLERINPKAHRLIDRKIKKGAELVSIENVDILQETLDWGRCLAVVLGPQVLRKVSAAYSEANQKRSELMLNRIDTNLQDEETSLLIIREEHALQFPGDIQVFYVSPPSLDDVRRSLREQIARAERVAESGNA